MNPNEDMNDCNIPEEVRLPVQSLGFEHFPSFSGRFVVSC